MIQGRQRVRGFTLISALFVLVVVSSLGVYMATLSTGQQFGSALTVRAAQATYAAKSGMELLRYQIGLGADCSTLPSALTIDGYSIALDQCASQSVTEGTTSYAVFDLILTASVGTFGDPAFASHRLSAVVTGG